MNGNLGFAGSVTTLKIVTIKDTNNGSVSTTDDTNYLGVQISGLASDLIGLESVLEFHASGVNVKVNKATDTDNNASTTPSKLDWDSLATSGITLASLAVDSAQDLHADGTVALNALSGVLVAKGTFDLDLGQVSTTAPSNGVSFTNASAVSLTLTGAAVFVGSGGSLSNATATANVVNGNLGFAGTVMTLNVVAIKDTNNGSVSATDDQNYLGVSISGLTADLIGLESVLEYHATPVNVKVNKATDTDNNASTTPSKLDWDSLTTSGMTLVSLAVDRALDVHADGTVALNALSGQELIITPNVAAPFAGQRNLSRKECIAVEANNQAQGDWRFKLNTRFNVTEHESPDVEAIKALWNQTKKQSYKGPADEPAFLTPDPVISRKFEGPWMLNGTPPDNSLAISTGGNIVAVNNDGIEYYSSTGTYFSAKYWSDFFTGNDITSKLYDPKVIFDSDKNRFIMVVLHGSKANVSKVLLAISYSDNPRTDGWFYYTIEADPTNSNSWFDYRSGSSASGAFPYRRAGAFRFLVHPD